MGTKTYFAITAVIITAFVVVVMLPTKTNMVKPADTVSTPDDFGQMIQFDEEDKQYGDLILVNYQTKYPIKPEKELTLANVYNEKRESYQVKDKSVYLAARIIYPLNRMLNQFHKVSELSTTVILSGYRTRDYQKNLYNEDVEQNGEQHASEYVANPGFSEHHIGLAIDLGIQFSDGTMSSFGNTNNEVWIRKNGHKYGFIKRYPDDKSSLTGIAGETWHYRYVGLPHAYYINKNKICLEEYLAFIQNNATSTFPLTIKYRNTEYNIYYTRENSIRLPENVFYNVSGDNQGGWIVTTTAEEDAFVIPPMNTTYDNKESVHPMSVASGGAVYGISGSVITADSISESSISEEDEILE
ncbi:MAG: M15 family metallopeptidase [Lachnoclostridium sp.]|jgi:D-alanyl-D-alanine carboxypeptidase|nr:M15 family metallopeptidase [Lachnoclostridium sp.]